MAQAAIESLLKNAMGLDTPSIGGAAIQRAVALRMSRTGRERQEEYLALVRTDNEELQELIEAVVVPETWFFRHGESFDALERLVMGHWLPTHALGTLRILSVPCSTGEEPYSIAMRLLTAGVPPLRFQVEAMDISGRVLAHAAHGVYGKNSFRSADLGFRDRYFSPVEGGFGIRREVRDQVQFCQGNILTIDTELNRYRYDIIFCRNLLIYFDRETQDQILHTLKQLINPSGTLFMGPAEALLMRNAGFSPTADPMAFGFTLGRAAARKPTTFEPPPLPKLPAATAPKMASPAPVAKAISQAVSERLPSPEPLASSKLGLEQAKALADTGKLGEAIEMCQAYLRQNGDTAAAHYLLGLMHDTRGDEHRAAEGYRKALYLDPNHREAMVHWALLAEKQGDSAIAQRLHARAKRLAENAA